MAVVDRIAGLLTGVAIKTPCRVATTANITLSGLQTIDGVSLLSSDRVLVKSQTDTTLNGIYSADSGGWTRTTDFDGTGDFVQGTIVAVVSGTLYNGTVWQLTTASPAIGSALAFAIMGTGALSGVSTFMQTVLPALTAAIARATLGAVGLTGDETVAGNKTFSGATTLAGLTMTGAINEMGRVDVASATTCLVAAANSNYIRLTGTTTVAAFDVMPEGTEITVVLAGALTLTHHPTSFILPTGENITTASGDTMVMRYEGDSNWRCVDYTRKNGTPLAISISTSTHSIASDINLDNTSEFFDGPSVAAPAGTVTGWASGTVTLKDTAGSAAYVVKLWDGTTVIDSAVGQSEVSGRVAISVSGPFSNPAGNIRISVKDTGSTNGVMISNDSGEGKDSTVSVMRLS